MNMENQELIKKYLHGTLSDEEVVLINAEMKSDTNFKKKVDNAVLLDQSFDMLIADDIRKTIQAIETEANSSRPWLKYAAAILLLIGVGFIFTQQMDTSSSDEIFAAYYFAPLNENTRSNTNELTIVNLSEAEMRYFQAHEHIASNQFEKANTIFSELGQSNNSMSQASQWFHALVLYKLDRKEEAMKILQGISSNTNHPYQKKAGNLLAE